MEFLKVLVGLIFVFQGSLSYPSDSKDELRVIAGQLERLVESLKQYVVEGNVPEFSMGGTELESEFPIPDTRPSLTPPLSPWGIEDERYPSSLRLQWFYETFGKLLKQYLGGFPNGPYTMDMPLTRDSIVVMLKAWYNNADQTFKRRAFLNVAGEVLDAHFQCATTRINQILFYILKDQARAIAENDQNINTRVRQILQSWITDTAVLEQVTQKILMSAHRHAYGEIMDYIRHFQFKDIVEFLGKMKMFLSRAGQNKWTTVMFEDKLNQLLAENDFVFRCQSANDIWKFHKEIATHIQQRYSVMKPSPDTEAWLQKLLYPYVTTEVPSVLPAILQVYTDYRKGAIGNFQQVENHVITGNAATITNSMSKFLRPDQLRYLQSIFEYLETTKTNGGKVYVD